MSTHRSWLQTCLDTFGPPIRAGQTSVTAQPVRTPDSTRGCWEVVVGNNGVMAHIRWSLPWPDGQYLWIRHYPATAWGMCAIERERDKLNEDGRLPDSFQCGFKKTADGGMVPYYPTDLPLFQN